MKVHETHLESPKFNKFINGTLSYIVLFAGKCTFRTGDLFILAETDISTGDYTDRYTLARATDVYFDPDMERKGCKIAIISLVSCDIVSTAGSSRFIVYNDEDDTTMESVSAN